LSTKLEVYVHLDGHIHYQEFSRGVPVADLKIIGDTERTGTTVHFIPDPEIFTETLVYEYDILATRLRELAFLNRGIKITIEDKRVENKQNEYYYEGGIKSYVEHLNRTKEVIHDEPIYLEGERDGITLEVALQYNEGYTESIYSFANNIHTYEGGTHESGFKTALTRVVNDYARVWDDTIYPNVRQVFGHDRDTDGDPKLYILFTKELNNFGSAGQFRGADKHPDSVVYPLYGVHSNEKDIFYVEIPDTDDIEYDKGTLAHEFQHMINFDARNDSYLLAEYAWLNEAFSGLAEYITGFGYQTWKLMRSFLTIPISLTCWATLNSRNYGGSYLFGRYLYEQFGTAAIKKMVQNIGYDGVFNVANVTGMDFNVVYNNWVIALCLSNTGLSYDPKYNFTTLNLRTNGFDGLKTVASYNMGTTVYGTFKPYCPAKVEWFDQTSNSMMTLMFHR
jgi:hypothetical protein